MKAKVILTIFFAVFFLMVGRPVLTFMSPAFNLFMPASSWPRPPRQYPFKIAFSEVACPLQYEKQNLNTGGTP